MDDLERLKSLVKERNISSGRDLQKRENRDVFDLFKSTFHYIEHIKFATAALYLTALENSLTSQPTCKTCGSPITYAKQGRFFREYCSPKCAAENDNTKEKRELTTIERFGVANVMSLDSTKETIKSRNMELYGVQHSLQREDVKKKSRDAVRKKYGNDFITQTTHFKQRTKDTLIARYGVETPMQSDLIKGKIKETCIERYGADNPLSSPEVREKIKSTNMALYGSETPLSNYDIRNKCAQTMCERYGVENPMQSEEIKSNTRETLMLRYGVSHISQYSPFLEKAKQTNIERYGVPYYFQTDDFKQAVKDLNNANYGVDSFQQRHFSENFDKISDRDFMANLYENYDFNTSRMAEYFGVDNTTILNYMHKLGLSDIVYRRSRSGAEYDLYTFITSVYSGEVLSNKRSILGGLELDIYIPELKIGIEFNGVYWHSSLYKDKKYHQNKAILCKDNDIKLMQVWEDDWNNEIKQQIIKTTLLSALGLQETTAYARKCRVVIVDGNVASEFLNANHIQGSTRASLWIVLYFNNVMVAVMGFKRLKNDTDDWDLVRYATSGLVVGGFSKLLTHFKKNYRWDSIVSFANLDYSHGNVYSVNGFTFEYITPPSLHYVVGNKRVRRERYMKHKLKSLFPDYDGSHVDTFLISKRIYPLYDSGMIKFRIDNV